MSQLKQAYMAATMDDMDGGPEEQMEYAERIRDGLREDGIVINMPDSIRREATLADFTSNELLREVIRRNGYSDTPKR